MPSGAKSEGIGLALSEKGAAAPVLHSISESLVAWGKHLNHGLPPSTRINVPVVKLDALLAR